MKRCAAGAAADFQNPILGSQERLDAVQFLAVGRLILYRPGSVFRGDPIPEETAEPAEPATIPLRQVNLTDWAAKTFTFQPETLTVNPTSLFALPAVCLSGERRPGG